jgi:formylglycine-generating enzyme required for sulfatase activity
MRRRTASLGLLMALLVLVVADMAGAGGQLGEPPPVILTTLLRRAGEYVQRYSEEFANVVAEERYVQQASGRRTLSEISRGRQRRELVSDFLLVKLAGGSSWVPFRDVFQVDGKPVREREERLADLVLYPTDQALEQAAAIIEESARYNIGDVHRTINMPLFSLGFLHPEQQSRFRFAIDGQDRHEGVNVFVVKFEERVSPTFVQTPDGRNLFASGRFWIEIGEGRVLKTEMAFLDAALRATITTSFRPDVRFKLDVPFEMVEEYILRNRSRVIGRASYGRFRRFDVTATETVSESVSGRSVVEFSTGMTLLEIAAGSFAMGSLASEAGRSADETMHDVTLGTEFYLGRFEVTEQEWRDVMGSLPRGAAECGPRCPVTNVSFGDVQGFLAKLNARSPEGIRFRLPTEAEWEYACRAGTASPYSTGESASAAQANFGGAALLSVGNLEANPWGLSDLHGNAAEWTADWYGAYPEGSATDPKGPASGRSRVIRGGSWQGPETGGRCGARASAEPGDRRPMVGFRVVADLVDP